MESQSVQIRLCQTAWLNYALPCVEHFICICINCLCNSVICRHITPQYLMISENEREKIASTCVHHLAIAYANNLNINYSDALFCCCQFQCLADCLSDSNVCTVHVNWARIRPKLLRIAEPVGRSKRRKNYPISRNFNHWQ